MLTDEIKPGMCYVFSVGAHKIVDYVLAVNPSHEFDPNYIRDIASVDITVLRVRAEGNRIYYTKIVDLVGLTYIDWTRL